MANNIGVVSSGSSNNCALHWLQVSLPADPDTQTDVVNRICEDIFSLDSSSFTESKNSLRGFTSYKNRLDYEGITLLKDHFLDGGILILLTGSACDTIAPDLAFIAEYLGFHCGKVSRIDIAVDDHIGLLDIAVINQARQENSVVTNFQKARAIDESDLKAGATTSPTVIFGASSSDLQIRFYDKAVKEGAEGHWVRCELQCRDKYADAVLSQLASGKTLAEVAMGVLQDKLSFRVPEGDNRKRWKVCEWWSDFLQNTERLSLGICKDRKQSSTEKSLKWLERNVAPTLATIRHHYGMDTIEALCDKGDLRLRTRRSRKQTASYREAA